jgi:hypothetical protein
MNVMSMLLVLFMCLPLTASGHVKLPLPITIRITATTPTVKVGSDVRIELTITNHSRRDLDTSANISELTGLDPNYTWDVRNRAGRKAPAKKDKNAELASGHAVFGSLNAEQSATIEQDISRLFDFSQPREYFIQASRQVQQDGKTVVVMSNELKVTVIR